MKPLAQELEKVRTHRLLTRAAPNNVLVRKYLQSRDGQGAVRATIFSQLFTLAALSWSSGR